MLRNWGASSLESLSHGGYSDPNGQIVPLLERTYLFRSEHNLQLSTVKVGVMNREVAG
jgi:hypothetical protein